MARPSKTILKIAWILAAAICTLTAENLWIDPWLQQKFHHKLPSFVPEALDGAWFLILLALVITVILLIVCQVLLMRDTHVSKRQKWLTGVLVLTAAILSGAWFVTTSGTTLAPRITAGETPQKRSVLLRWQPSTTPEVKYNVYRGPFWGVHPDKLNSAPIEGTSFSDTGVVSGQTYWYIVRAVNAKGEESIESNDSSATIP